MGSALRWIIDLDGVVWKGKEIIWENVDAIKKLEGKKVFLTNKATSRWEVSRRLKEIGLEGEVVTSAYIASQFLKKRGVESAFAVGPSGLAEELVMAGIHLTEDEDLAQAVVAGLDAFLTYDKVARAASMIRKGALFVATNTDKTYPTERGLMPGAGSVVEAIRVASGKEPVVVGKPSRHAFEVASGGERDVIVIGDKMETDMKMALENGARGILVLTGVTREPPKEVPQGVTVVKTLKEVLGDETG
ncbi:HAD-superfamily hydrolase, subfamily IIA [Ignicoccus hospitalis KIN4/I]|uniref:HAD-superfamily hydrolase, subfamily IIA n=1 Tax=Ignicoccus hospitalis (strain KIN4/I / DSM 18386 / JCM 14125) TaxID=453591 RepID=A8AA79_IGNH4|nr:HAD-superfamily hydrolase, subfamily IIA [Ignicoccus hospitalis KIN4/I]